MENTRTFRDPAELSEESDHFPAVPLELVEALEHTFPDKLPDKHTDEKELSYLIGQVNVVKFLREQSGRRT